MMGCNFGIIHISFYFSNYVLLPLFWGRIQPSTSPIILNTYKVDKLVNSSNWVGPKIIQFWTQAVYKANFLTKSSPTCLYFIPWTKVLYFYIQRKSSLVLCLNFIKYTFEFKNYFQF